MLPIVYVSHPLYQKHLTGKGHPECPERCIAILSALEKAGLLTSNNTLSARKALPEDIFRCHSQKYYHIAEQEIRKCGEAGITDGSQTLSTGDVQICPDSFEAAMLAAGGVLTGIDAVMSRKAKAAFCIVRPPGHHAESYRGMGFCIFNNIAIGARYAQTVNGIERVLIVDWDVHHGNGTQEIFESDPSVFYFSTHQQYLYPGTGLSSEKGEGGGKGTLLNIPIPAGSGSREKILAAFEGPLIDSMRLFKPQLVMISAGFDGHKDDPLGSFSLTSHDFGTLTTICRNIADEFAEGRIISVLEGGYNLNALASSSVEHVKAHL